MRLTKNSLGGQRVNLFNFFPLITQNNYLALTITAIVAM